MTVVRLLLVRPPVGLKSTWSLTFSLPFFLIRVRARLVSLTVTVSGPPLTRKAFVAISLRAFFALAKAGGQDAAASVRRAGVQVTPTSCGEQTAPLPGTPGGSVSLSRAVMHSPTHVADLGITKSLRGKVGGGGGGPPLGGGGGGSPVCGGGGLSPPGGGGGSPGISRSKRLMA